MPARILLVEDNTDIREITGRLLVNSGYYVESAANGEEALTHYKRQIFDLIITDIFMPVMDGNQLIKELQKLNEINRVPPIVVLSYSNFEVTPSPLITVTALKTILLNQLRTLILQVLDDNNSNEFRDIFRPKLPPK